MVVFNLRVRLPGSEPGGTSLLVVLLCASLLKHSGPISLPRKTVIKTMDVPQSVIFEI